MILPTSLFIYTTCIFSKSKMAGNEGFEPPILGPEPSALPLGQFPLVRRTRGDYTKKHTTLLDLTKEF